MQDTNIQYHPKIFTIPYIIALLAVIGGAIYVEWGLGLDVFIFFVVVIGLYMCYNLLFSWNQFKLIEDEKVFEVSNHILTPWPSRFEVEKISLLKLTQPSVKGSPAIQLELHSKKIKKKWGFNDAAWPALQQLLKAVKVQGVLVVDETQEPEVSPLLTTHLHWAMLAFWISLATAAAILSYSIQTNKSEKLDLLQRTGVYGVAKVTKVSSNNHGCYYMEYEFWNGQAIQINVASPCKEKGYDYIDQYLLVVYAPGKPEAAYLLWQKPVRNLEDTTQLKSLKVDPQLLLDYNRSEQ